MVTAKSVLWGEFIVNKCLLWCKFDFLMMLVLLDGISKAALQSLLEKLFCCITPKLVFIYIKKNGSFFFFAFKWMIIAIGIFHFYNVQGGYCVNLAQSIICYAVTDAFCHWDNMLKRRFSTLWISYSLHCLYFAKAQLLSKNVTFLSLQLLSLSLQLPVTNLGNCVT